MTRIIWDQTGDRFYEAGVSQGVFYDSDGKGVPWNGLISVEESNNEDVEPLYFDGVKYADLVTLSNFEGTLKAFTYPDEFIKCEGSAYRTPGFYLTDQPKSQFGLSYKTEINNDLGENNYKLHIIYNITAIPSDKTYETMSLDTDPTEFQWDISAIPEPVDRFRPTAHVIIDTRKIDPFLLKDIEDILYGTLNADPRLPILNGLVNFVNNWGRLIITDNGDGTWTATSPLEGVITMLD